MAFISKKELIAIVSIIVIICTVGFILNNNYESLKINWTFDIPEIDGYTHVDPWTSSTGSRNRGMFYTVEYNKLPYTITGRNVPNSKVYVHAYYYTKTVWSGDNIQGFYDFVHAETYTILIIDNEGKLIENGS